MAELDSEFQRGLEELVRGHLDGCITGPGLASSSSSSSCAGGEDEQLARRRRRSHLEGDELAESSAAARRQSRILSRWAARQAEEMITNIERRNRETELMALAGLHTVSMLDSSFLREPGRSPSSSLVERPAAARASSILQMRRELEHLTAAARGRRGSATESLDGDRSHAEGRGLGGSSVAASETDYNSYDQWSRADLDLLRRPGEEDDRRSSREQSPDLGEGERERVRQIVRGWVTESVITETEPRISPRNEVQRAEWLGEIERERVRLVREWVQMASQQQRDARASRRGREMDRDELVTDTEDGQPEHVQRELLRLRGRQARLELIMRMVTERQSELQSLSEHHAVSEFAHRNRIQEETMLERRVWEPVSEVGLSQWHTEDGGDFDENWQENLVQDWVDETPENGDEGDNHLPEAQEGWHEDESHVTEGTWQDENSDVLNDSRASPSRRVDRFIPPDDENVYSMELRELLSSHRSGMLLMI